MSTNIGYKQAKNLMQTENWLLRVIVTDRDIIQRAELFDPASTKHCTVRRDSAKRLSTECKIHDKIARRKPTP